MPASSKDMVNNSHTNSNSLFVGDLSKFCNEEDIEKLFSPFGMLTEVKIKRNSVTSKTLSYGFVTFLQRHSAAMAMKQLDGKLFCGRKMRIRWAQYNARSTAHIESIINSVYVRYVTTKIQDLITEEHLHAVFDGFGNVADVSIKESAFDEKLGRQSGYGFVHFTNNPAGVESAFQAVAAVDNVTVNNITFNVELSKNLLKQLQEKEKLVKQNSVSVANGSKLNINCHPSPSETSQPNLSPYGSSVTGFIKTQFSNNANEHYPRYVERKSLSPPLVREIPVKQLVQQPPMNLVHTRPQDNVIHTLQRAGISQKVQLHHPLANNYFVPANGGNMMNSPNSFNQNMRCYQPNNFLVDQRNHSNNQCFNNEGNSNQYMASSELPRNFLTKDFYNVSPTLNSCTTNQSFNSSIARSVEQRFDVSRNRLNSSDYNQNYSTTTESNAPYGFERNSFQRCDSSVSSLSSTSSSAMSPGPDEMPGMPSNHNSNKNQFLNGGNVNNTFFQNENYLYNEFDSQMIANLTIDKENITSEPLFNLWGKSENEQDILLTRSSLNGPESMGLRSFSTISSLRSISNDRIDDILGHYMSKKNNIDSTIPTPLQLLNNESYMF
eukprot:gene9530-12837_t